MTTSTDKNYISIGSWLLTMLVLAIPCVGTIMFFVWMFSGENETRKNFFRAWFIMSIIVGLLVGLLALLGLIPVIMQAMQNR